MPETSENKSLTLFSYSLLLKRRNGALPGLGSPHSTTPGSVPPVVPPLGPPVLELDAVVSDAGTESTPMVPVHAFAPAMIAAHASHSLTRALPEPFCRPAIEVTRETSWRSVEVVERQARRLEQA